MNSILTAREVAEYLRLHRSTLYRWRRHGIGPTSFTAGTRAIRYRRTDVDNWITLALVHTLARSH